MRDWHSLLFWWWSRSPGPNCCPKAFCPTHEALLSQWKAPICCLLMAPTIELLPLYIILCFPGLEHTHARMLMSWSHFSFSRVSMYHETFGPIDMVKCQVQNFYHHLRLDLNWRINEFDFKLTSFHHSFKDSHLKRQRNLSQLDQENWDRDGKWVRLGHNRLRWLGLSRGWRSVHIKLIFSNESTGHV